VGTCIPLKKGKGDEKKKMPRQKTEVGKSLASFTKNTSQQSQVKRNKKKFKGLWEKSNTREGGRDKSTKRKS